MAGQPGRAPKIGKRALDALFADIPRERRRRFFAKAYEILEKSADEILRSESGEWGLAVPKFREDRGLTLMKMAAEIAGVAERAAKREEPFIKLAAALTAPERPDKIIFEDVTSPADPAESAASADSPQDPSEDD